MKCLDACFAGVEGDKKAWREKEVDTGKEALQGNRRCSVLTLAEWLALIAVMSRVFDSVPRLGPLESKMNKR